MSEWKENVSLQSYNTFGIDITARRFVQIDSIADIHERLEEVQNTGEVFILGGGSNVLFSGDLDREVFYNQIKQIEKIDEDENHVYINCGAGEIWHDLVIHCVNQGWAGIENLSLIPGNTGAAPMQNIGAYGVELKDVFHSLRAYHLYDKELHSFDTKDCQFGYRESVFKRKFKGQYIITEVVLKLDKNPTFHTSYGAIKEELEAMNVQELSIDAISKAVINIRRRKLPDPAQIGNAGSFFKNPVVEKAQFDSIQKAHPEIAAYPAGEKVKIAAGWLIDRAGWKGFRAGDCGVHKNQALVLVNYGGASGQQIYDLSEEIKQDILSKYGVELEREVNVF